jgi:dTMP kinase
VVVDRLVAEGDDFFDAIAAAYDAFAAADPARWVVLDATLAPDVLLAAALDALGR